MKTLFNASVVLSGLRSNTGASHELLMLVRKGKLQGKISEIIFGEIIKNAYKLDLQPEVVKKQTEEIYKEAILEAPMKSSVEVFRHIVLDFGDAHVLASAVDEKCEVLVTLDKKHLLVLKGKVENLEILSPSELLEKLA